MWCVSFFNKIPSCWSFVSCSALPNRTKLPQLAKSQHTGAGHRSQGTVVRRALAEDVEGQVMNPGSWTWRWTRMAWWNVWFTDFFWPLFGPCIPLWCFVCCFLVHILRKDLWTWSVEVDGVLSSAKWIRYLFYHVLLYHTVSFFKWAPKFSSYSSPGFMKKGHQLVGRFTLLR